jgi:hypothetical protein
MTDESSNVIEFKSLRDRVRREKPLETPAETALPGGGGGGTFGGMEARVARLEADVGHIKSDIGEIKTALTGLSAHVGDARVIIGTLTERISHLPSKAYIGTWITGAAAAVILGLSLLAHFGWLVAGTPAH